MAIQNSPDNQKVDYLWKKIGYGVAKTDIAGNIDATNEPYASPLLIRSDTIWTQSGSIPAVIPSSNSSVVTVYPSTFPIQSTNDAGIPTPTLTWVTGVTNWIPPEFGSTYQVKVYIAPSGDAANAATKGTQVFATGSGNNDEWFFDYKAGILNFNSNSTPYSGGGPISFTGNSVYISGGVYAGTFGIPSANAVLGNLVINNTTLTSNSANANIYITAPGTGTVQITGNLAVGIPAGTTAQRPTNPVIGDIRYNTDTQDIEFWTGSNWITPGAAVITSDAIYPNGTSNVYVLSSNATTTGVMVSINGTLQQPYTAYNIVNNNQIQFTEIPLTSDAIEVRHIVAGTQVLNNTSMSEGQAEIYLDIANINIQGNVLPVYSNAYSIGSPTLEWNAGYFNTLNTTGDTIVGGNLTVLGTTTTVNQEIINQNEIVTGNLSASGNVTVYGNLNVFGTMANTITIPASVNQLYVAENGNDSNNGSFNQPFLTIKAALAASTSGTSVHVAPGTYTEANPITIPSGVALIGDNLRSVTILPQTATADLFYMTNGSYVWGITIKNYLANGFSYSSATSSQNVFVSPYIQNVTSSTTTGTAVMVDGNFTSSISTKAMIVGFFTIINQGGVGVHLTNSAYSQLVNIYTIAANVGIWTESGSFCTLNGSDNSIGNIGLRADGYGPLNTSGNTAGYSTFGTFNITNMTTAPHVNEVMVINGDANFYSIDTITQANANTYTVSIQQTYTANLVPNTGISFYNRSEIVASAHTFEYVGAGINPANALPQYGGYPNANLNVVTTNGGSVTYTATDEKGQFWIGSNLVINQVTGTISGAAFERSLFALMTPYILALEI